MKLRLSLPIAVFLTLLTVALCTGSQLFLLLSVMILLIVLAVLVTALAVLGRVAPEWLDSFLYSTEELEILHK